LIFRCLLENISYSSLNDVSINSQNIIEDGSHQELLDLNGHYKNLWDSQVGGFLIEISN
jgi:hypothetical protein